MIKKILFLLTLLSLFCILSTTLLASFSPKDARDQLLFFAVLVVPERAVARTSIVLYVLSIILLFLTLIVGITTKGSTRWISVGGVRIQTGEFAKPILALGLAWYICKKGVGQLSSFSIAMGLIAIPVGLVFIQPDLGSSLVLAAIGLGALMTVEWDKRFLIPWTVLFIGFSLFSWQFLLHGYQRLRILSFIYPNSDVHAAASYNATQALIAVGSGKLFGRGLGHGIQSTLQFLPEHATDFFFASLSEELGFIGALFALTLYGSLFIILYFLQKGKALFAVIYIRAIMLGICIQTFIHIGMNIGLLPVTGIPLPLLSAGGSSLLSVFLSLGLAVRLSNTRAKIPLI